MKTWFPLEANPEQLSQLLLKYVPTTKLRFSDIYTMDDVEMLFPFEFEAILLLFPIVEGTVGKAETSANQLLDMPSSSAVFLRQYVDNACGSIAVLHALLNASQSLWKGSPELEKLHELKTPEERGKFIQNTEAFYDKHNSCIDIGSERSANDGDLNTNLHFVCFLVKDGLLLEMDGRYASPITHGPLSSSLLQDTIRVVKKRVECTESLEFTLIGLTDEENL